MRAYLNLVIKAILYVNFLVARKKLPLITGIELIAGFLVFCLELCSVFHLGFAEVAVKILLRGWIKI
jgi:hypothetical protein